MTETLHQETLNPSQQLPFSYPQHTSQMFRPHESTSPRLLLTTDHTSIKRLIRCVRASRRCKVHTTVARPARFLLFFFPLRAGRAAKSMPDRPGQVGRKMFTQNGGRQSGHNNSGLRFPHFVRLHEAACVWVNNREKQGSEFAGYGVVTKTAAVLGESGGAGRIL